MRAERRKGKNRRRWLPRIIYMLFLIATIVYVSNRGGAFSYALFYATVIYPPLAWLYLLYVRAKIRVSQELPYREVRKGTEETYQLTIENSGWLPVSGIRLFHRTGTVLREDMAGEVLSFFPKEKKVFSTWMSFSYAGSHEAGLDRITFRDGFGLMEITMRISNPLRLQVLPLVTSVAAEDMERATWDLTHGAPGRQKDQENTLGVDLMRYNPGDPLKRIHWKNYARSGELMVRLPEEKEYRMLVIALFACPSEEGKEGLIQRDRFLEYAVSVAGIFAEQRQPVQFLFFQGEVRQQLVEDLEGMQELCRALSREFILRGNPSAVEARLTEAAGQQDAPALYIREGENRLCPM